jgi:Spy/CpxP family protein refolding chaperone
MRQQQLGMARQKQLEMAFLLMGGLSAYTLSLPYQVSPPDVGQVIAANPSESNAPPTAERAQQRAAVRKQVEAVLTPEQVQQLQSKLDQSNGRLG